MAVPKQQVVIRFPVFEISQKKNGDNIVVHRERKQGVRTGK